MNSDILLNTLISTSIPTLVNTIWNKIHFQNNIFNNFKIYDLKLRLKNRYCTTLYGTLCLIYQVDDLHNISSNYNAILDWLSQSLYWVCVRLYGIQIVGNDQMELAESSQNDRECLNAILNKILKIFNKNKIILNDTIPYLTSMSKKGRFLNYLSFETWNF